MCVIPFTSQLRKWSSKGFQVTLIGVEEHSIPSGFITCASGHNVKQYKSSSLYIWPFMQHHMWSQDIRLKSTECLVVSHATRKLPPGSRTQASVTACPTLPIPAVFLVAGEISTTTGTWVPVGSVSSITGTLIPLLLKAVTGSPTEEREQSHCGLTIPLAKYGTYGSGKQSRLVDPCSLGSWSLHYSFVHSFIMLSWVFIMYHIIQLLIIKCCKRDMNQI